MQKEMQRDFKKHMWGNGDPHHLLNKKNQFGHTPLTVAAKNGNLNIVAFLLEEGANPHLTCGDGENLLQVAARWDMFSIVSYLIEKVEWSAEEVGAAMR